MCPAPARLPGAVLALLLAAALAPTFAAAAGAALSPAGPETRIDADDSCVTEDPDLAVVPGGFVGVWIDEGDVVLRRLDGSGRPQGAVEVVAAGGRPEAPEVEAIPAGAGGGVVVVWFDRERQRILARRTGQDGQLGPELELGFAGQSDTGFGGLDLAVTPSGNAVVAWATEGGVLLREVRTSTSLVGQQPYLVESYGGVLGFDPVTLDPVVLVSPADGLVRVFWVASSILFGDFDPYGSIEGKVIEPLGAGVYDVVRTVGGVDVGTDLEGAMAADGTYLLAWVVELPDTHDPPTGYVGPYLRGRVFDAADVPGDPLALDDLPTFWSSVTDVAVAALPAGGWVVAWGGSLTAPASTVPTVFGRQIAADGTPLGDVTPWPATPQYGTGKPDVAVGQNGLVVGIWSQAELALTPPACSGGRGIVTRPFGVGCGAPGAFCVDQGRFRVALTYADPARNLAGTGNGVALTADSGYFWFFAPDNVEVVVKVLDGRAVNGHYWVFYGGLTDVGFTLAVTDTATGAERVFEHAPGTLASRGVTDAFPSQPPYQPGSAVAGAGAPDAGTTVRRLRTVALVRDAFGGDPRPSALGRVAAPALAALGEDTAAGPCSPPELPVVPGPGLCLNARRFAVTADWRDFAGGSGVGHGVALGDDSGYFWFFDPANVELVVKVLDGRPVNGHFWVFYGALSSVEYDLEVRHVLADEAGADGTATYHNPPGTFASVADTSALRPPQSRPCPLQGYAPVCGRDGVTYGDECDAHWIGWVEKAHDGPCP